MAEGGGVLSSDSPACNASVRATTSAALSVLSWAPKRREQKNTPTERQQGVGLFSRRDATRRWCPPREPVTRGVSTLARVSLLAKRQAAERLTFTVCSYQTAGLRGAATANMSPALVSLNTVNVFIRQNRTSTKSCSALCSLFPPAPPTVAAAYQCVSAGSQSLLLLLFVFRKHGRPCDTTWLDTDKRLTQCRSGASAHRPSSPDTDRVYFALCSGIFRLRWRAVDTRGAAGASQLQHWAVEEADIGQNSLFCTHSAT